MRITDEQTKLLKKLMETSNHNMILLSSRSVGKSYFHKAWEETLKKLQEKYEKRAKVKVIFT